MAALPAPVDRRPGRGKSRRGERRGQAEAGDPEAGDGIDPIHYAIVIVAAVGIGLFLPPVGVGRFIACGIADVSVEPATPAVLAFIAVLCVGLAVIIAAPWFTLVLPRLFKLL